MLVIVPTHTQINSVELILKLLRRFSVFLHQRQGAYKLCQLKL